MLRNKNTNTIADYEVEIGKTVFHVHHEFGDNEISELLAEYITNEQEITVAEKKQAA